MCSKSSIRDSAKFSMYLLNTYLIYNNITKIKSRKFIIAELIMNICVLNVNLYCHYCMMIIFSIVFYALRSALLLLFSVAVMESWTIGGAVVVVMGSFIIEGAGVEVAKEKLFKGVLT